MYDNTIAVKPNDCLYTKRVLLGSLGINSENKAVQLTKRRIIRAGLRSCEAALVMSRLEGLSGVTPA